MSNQQLLDSIEDLITSLTFKRIFLLSLLTAISLLLLLVFENRAVLFTRAVNSGPREETVFEWKMSTKSKETLTALTMFSPVTFVGIIDVDLKKNRRKTKWFHSKDAQIEKMIDAIVVAALPQPVFDFDVRNTQQMIALLNNEFVCVQSAESALAHFWGPLLTNRIPVICRMAIPPYVGKFVGYVTIGVTTTLTKNQLDALKMEATRIAIEIYISDVDASLKNPQE